MGDAALLDEALRSLLLEHREAEIDASYAAYDAHPIDEPDEWGDLASWRSAAGVVTDRPARGELWWSELPAIGRRPAVVLSRDHAIPRLGRTMVASCTTNISIESVSVGVLVERLGRLSDWRMRQICAAIGVAVGCREQSRSR